MNNAEELVFVSTGEAVCPRCGSLLVRENDYYIADIMDDVPTEYADGVLTIYHCPECNGIYDVINLNG